MNTDEPAEAEGGSERTARRSVPAFGTLVRGFTDMVFPPVCLGCGGLVEGGRLRHVCVTCEPLIHRIEAPCCVTCGSPFFGEVEGERMLSALRRVAPAL